MSTRSWSSADLGKQQLVILGGAGDGMVVAQAIRDLHKAGGKVMLAGFLNDRIAKGDLIYGVPALGPLRAWSSLTDDICFVAALHKVGQMRKRAAMISDLNIPESRWATIVHPTACIADDVVVGSGSFIASHVTIQPGACVGRFVSVRAGANIGHDAVVSDFAYMGPNSTIAGRAQLEEGAHLGPNAAVLDSIRVGRYAVVGLCSAATKNVDDDTVCFGVPAKLVSVKVMDTR